MLHFRDRNSPEVDVIVEDRRSGVVSGVEVKSTSTPRAEHARHLALLRDRFAVGVVLHLGAAVLPLGALDRQLGSERGPNGETRTLSA